MKNRIMGEITAQTFFELKSEIVNRFSNIKEDIFKSSVYSFEEYNIYGTVISKEDLKVFENHFFPLIKEDLDKIDLLEKLRFADEDMLVENIFINENMNIIDYLDNTIIDGKIITDKGSFPATFQIRKNKKYFEKIYELYKITEKNKLNWQIPNLPYANKYMEIYLEDYDEAVLESTEIKEIEYYTEASYFKGLIFCWNIRERELEYEEFVKPTEEQLTYEYIVNVSYNRKYLVNLDTGELMISYIADENSIIFITDQKISGKLKLWEILEKTAEDLEEYLIHKVYSNEASFSDRKELLYHKEDIRTLVDSLKDIHDIKLEDIVFDIGGQELLKTINFNSFLKEEFEIKNKREKAYLKLEYKEDLFLNEIVSYIISVLNIRNKDFEFRALKI